MIVINQTEYSAVRDGGAGLIDLSSRGRILISGSEAVMFLNGLITNDIKSLAAGSWMPAAFLNVQGRVLAVVRILHREDGFLIDTEAATRQKIVQMLDRFTLAGDFRVTDLSAETNTFSVQGARSAEVARAVLGQDVSNLDRDRVISVGPNDLTVIRATHTSEDGFDLFVGASGADSLRQSLIDAGARTINDDVAETLRIEAGIPRYAIDIDESTIISETNFDDAVSFTKGCYIGQEIVIRIKHRGHVAKKLTGIVLEERATIEPGEKIFAGDKEIGRVTSTTFSPKLKHRIALGYVKYDYLAAGTEVKIEADGQIISGTVSELPLVRGSWYSD